MNKRVRLTSSAKRDFLKILEYLEENWSTKVASSFIDILEENQKIISSDPSQFPYFNKPLNIRKCVVTKHNTLYFREEASEIQILRIYDVCQHPSGLHF